MKKNTNISFKTFYYNDEECRKFFSLFRECAQKFGCYYMGYIYEDFDAKTRWGFTTNPDWQRIYIGNHLVDECHLWQEVSRYYSNTDKQYLILPWLLIRPETSNQKDIILYREEIGIGQNGISFCSQTSRTREYLYFAPNKNEPHFLKHVSSNMSLIKKCCRQFRISSVVSQRYINLTNNLHI